MLPVNISENMNSELIYPTCPDCENKASKGNGVTARRASRKTFDWYCPECNTVHTGNFLVGASRVQWHYKSDGTIFTKLKHKL